MNDRLWIYFLFPGLPMLFLYWQIRVNLRRRSDARLPFYQLRRPPGYGLQRRAEDQSDLVAFSIAAVMMTAVAPSLVYVAGASLWSALAIGVVLCPITLRQLWKDWKPLPILRLGLIGEQATGGVLDGLSSEKVRIFHDLVISERGKTWNIDHIVLTPAGLFCVETKTRKKKRLDSKDWELTFDGEGVHFPGGNYDTAALNQTARNAHWLATRAHGLTGGDRIPIFPVLVYPGWMVHRTGKGPVQVVNHKELPHLVPNGGAEISPQSFRALDDWLSRQCVIELSDEPEKKSAGRSSHHNAFHPKRTPNQNRKRVAASSQPGEARARSHALNAPPTSASVSPVPDPGG